MVFLPGVIAERRRGLLFAGNRAIGNGVGLARSVGVESTSRDVFLDGEQTADQIGARLHDVENIARKRGRVIAIGHPHDATLAALTEWFRTLPEKGYVLVPISAMVKVPEAGN